MTLMELLVALVIGSLVITLVVRGLGLSLNLYERVGRITASLDVEFRENAWWTDSVASLTPCVELQHCVQGTGHYFQGYTLGGVMHPPGQRIPVRWELADVDNGQQLRLREGAGNPATVTMAKPLPAGARFTYLAPDGHWYHEWNPEEGTVRLPVAIRITTGDDRVLAFATPVQRPYGQPDYRDMLGP